jgi:hypothetical protein
MMVETLHVPVPLVLKNNSYVLMKWDLETLLRTSTGAIMYPVIALINYVAV